MKKFVLCIGIISLSFFGICQGEYCDSLKSEVLIVNDLYNQEKADKFILSFTEFEFCGPSIEDIQFWIQRTYSGEFIISGIDTMHSITKGFIFDKMLEDIASEDFKEKKERSLFMSDILNQKATLAVWQERRLEALEIGLELEFIEIFDAYLEDPTNEVITYNEILILWNKTHLEEGLPMEEISD